MPWSGPAALHQPLRVWRQRTALDEPFAPRRQQILHRHHLLVLVSQVANGAVFALLVYGNHGTLIVQAINVGGAGKVADLEGHRPGTKGRILRGVSSDGGFRSSVLLLALVGGIGQAACQFLTGQANVFVVKLDQQGVVPHSGVGLVGHLTKLDSSRLLKIRKRV